MGSGFGCTSVHVEDTGPYRRMFGSLGGRYTDQHLWMDKIVAASADVIKMIKQPDAGGFPI